MMEAIFDGNVSDCPCENVEAFPLFLCLKICPTTSYQSGRAFFLRGYFI